jgi:hypothetical protein
VLAKLPVVVDRELSCLFCQRFVLAQFGVGNTQLFEPTNAGKIKRWQGLVFETSLEVILLGLALGDQRLFEVEPFGERPLSIDLGYEIVFPSVERQDNAILRYR